MEYTHTHTHTHTHTQNWEHVVEFILKAHFGQLWFVYLLVLLALWSWLIQGKLLPDIWPWPWVYNKCEPFPLLTDSWCPEKIWKRPAPLHLPLLHPSTSPSQFTDHLKPLFISGLGKLLKLSVIGPFTSEVEANNRTYNRGSLSWTLTMKIIS